MMPIEAAENLVGKVKKVESETVSLFEENGNRSEHLESKSNSLFDEANNLVEISHQYADENSHKTINKYDSKKRLIVHLTYLNETLKYKSEFTYNDRDQMVEAKFVDFAHELQSGYRPVYTKEGLRVDETIYDPFLYEGKNVISQTSFSIAPEIRVSFSLKNVYREKRVSGIDGQTLEVTFFNRFKLPTGKISVIYDADEKPFKIIKYGDDTIFPAGDAPLIFNFFFGILTKLSDFLMTLVMSVKLVARKEYKQALNCLIFGAPIDETVVAYNDQNKVSEIYFRSIFAGAGSKTVFSYDEQGNKTEMNAFSGDETLYHSEKHEYQYDSQKNWITRKTFYRLAVGNGNRFHERTILTRRKIEYFEIY